ncbi:MAG: recombination protein RecR [Ruminococcaceae bacterium]|nr:recombination protein RecR [Oscillospiraceae bacterium]
MNFFAAPVARLIEEFEKLPGIGSKTAQRLAYHMLNIPKDAALSFADAIREAREKVHTCSVCQDLTEHETCRICQNPKRDRNTICVVESPKDVIAMERTREYTGVYHVLHGALSPMDGIGPGDIRIKELVTRLGTTDVTEVILATNSTVEGEATAMYLARLLKPFQVKITRIAHGIPMGGDLEYTDEVTLAKALEGRREL